MVMLDIEYSYEVPRLKRLTTTDHSHHPIICGKISLQRDLSPYWRIYTFAKK